MKTIFFNGNDPKCTLVCINNNNKIYDDFIANLKSQYNLCFKLITIENIDNHIKGARIAFNETVDNVVGDYVFFLHPDIRFLEAETLLNIFLMVKTLNNLGIVGIAGVSTKEGKKYSSIIHGKEKKSPGIPVSSYIEVQTVDECFFGMKTCLFRKYPFCNEQGWHLYAVEQCLYYSKLGFKNYVVNAEVWHQSSGGSLDYSYFLYFKKLIKKYSTLDYINTTVFKCKTKGIKTSFVINSFLIKLYLRKLIKGK